jgi:hypothetical protein
MYLDSTLITFVKNEVFFSFIYYCITFYYFYQSNLFILFKRQKHIERQCFPVRKPRKQAGNFFNSQQRYYTRNNRETNNFNYLMGLYEIYGVAVLIKKEPLINSSRKSRLYSGSAIQLVVDHQTGLLSLCYSLRRMIIKNDNKEE